MDGRGRAENKVKRASYLISSEPTDWDFSAERVLRFRSMSRVPTLYTAFKSHDPGHEATRAFLTMRFFAPCFFTHNVLITTYNYRKENPGSIPSPGEALPTEPLPLLFLLEILFRVQKMIWNNR